MTDLLRYACILINQITSDRVTAVATVVLAALTFYLARATIAMAGRANVVASIDRNQWSIKLQDLVVHNAGNAPAFDVKIKVSPSLPTSFPRADGTLPLNKISILRPGQIISSSLSESTELTGTYDFEISWKKKPSSWKRTRISYTINLQEMGPMSQWGHSSPLIDMAHSLQKIRGDIVSLVRNRHLKVDTFSNEDRERERAETLNRIAEFEKKRAEVGTPPSPKSDS